MKIWLRFGLSVFVLLFCCVSISFADKRGGTTRHPCGPEGDLPEPDNSNLLEQLFAEGESAKPYEDFFWVCKPSSDVTIEDELVERTTDCPAKRARGGGSGTRTEVFRCLDTGWQMVRLHFEGRLHYATTYASLDVADVFVHKVEISNIYADNPFTAEIDYEQRARFGLAVRNADRIYGSFPHDHTTVDFTVNMLPEEEGEDPVPTEVQSIRYTSLANRSIKTLKWTGPIGETLRKKETTREHYQGDLDQNVYTTIELLQFEPEYQFQVPKYGWKYIGHKALETKRQDAFVDFTGYHAATRFGEYVSAITGRRHWVLDVSEYDIPLFSTPVRSQAASYYEEGDPPQFEDYFKREYRREGLSHYGWKSFTASSPELEVSGNDMKATIYSDRAGSQCSLTIYTADDHQDPNGEDRADFLRDLDQVQQLEADLELEFRYFGDECR